MLSYCRRMTALLLTAMLGACVPDNSEPELIPNIETTLLKEKYVGPWIEVILGGNSEAFVLMQDGTVKPTSEAFHQFTHWSSPGEVLYLSFTHSVDGTVKTEEKAFPVTCEAGFGCRIEMINGPIWNYSR